MKEPLVFIALFCFSVLCSRVNSQAADSCSSNLNNLNVQLPFDTSSFTCQTVWASQSFILRVSSSLLNTSIYIYIYVYTDIIFIHANIRSALSILETIQHVDMK